MDAPGSVHDHPPALADHVHAARLADGLVLLDVAHDRYLCLYQPAREDGVATIEQAVVDQLFERGLVAPGGTRPLLPDPRAAPIVWQDLGAVAPARIAVYDLAIFLISLARAAFRFHTRSFAALVAGSRRTPAPAAALTRYRDVVSRFELMSLFLPFRMQCLFRSHFLLHVLRAHGLPADWVFGVSLFPFHAHCWLAVGDRLVGERSEKTEDLALILTVTNALASAS